MVDTLKYLKKGGRISPLVAFTGELMGIKPMISVVNGKAEVIGKVIGLKKAVAYINKEIENVGGIDFDMPFYALYSGVDQTKIDNYIRDNCSDEISNTEIGAIFGYHPFYVSKVLKDKKGQTLRQYIISYRLKAAKRALELTDKSAAEIAEENGFTDASYFAKTFKAAFGITPKDYRNKFKEDFI